MYKILVGLLVKYLIRANYGYLVCFTILDILTGVEKHYKETGIKLVLKEVLEQAEFYGWIEQPPYRSE